MNDSTIWTCDQFESRLSDYLDGALGPAEGEAFLAHSRSCERCAPLLAGVSGLVRGLHSLEPAEEPAHLVYKILDQTLGPREAASRWRLSLDWLRALVSPKVAYGLVAVAATLGVLLTASGFSWRQPRFADLRPAAIYRNADRQAHLIYARSAKFFGDLRIVYQIQARFRPESDIAPDSDNSAPPPAPQKQKQPGSSNGPESAPRQNRAIGPRPGATLLAVNFASLRSAR
ncbi:MAG TPA: zf-HC2 domain-containing protein [Methylomirabilota bacterium]|nr:zf-HC2 domain-containing protein [Methylomirabilota bacterium]